MGVAAAAVILGAGSAGAITLTDQDSNTSNSGVAVANSGGNLAVGNASDNDADSKQKAKAGAADDDSVAVNSGTASNSSDGSASIRTGNADAVGNQSSTTQRQAAASGGGGLVVADQKSTVDNAGVGIANTGFNVAAGNASVNDATNKQKAKAGSAGDDSIAVNIGGASNDSDGSASIVTGRATAAGNVSTTTVGQALGSGGGITVADQDSDVTNVGLGIANSGFNLAAGNTSVNDVDGNQKSKVGSANGDVVSFNNGSATNRSDGSSSVITGDAAAVGNSSSTNVGQALNTGSNWSNSGGALAPAGTAASGGGPSLATAASGGSRWSIGDYIRWLLWSALHGF